MQIFIYTLEDPRTGHIKYVGKSNKPKRRYANHICTTGNTYTNNWIKSLRGEGLKPLLQIVDEGNESNWEELEIYWISQFKTWGFNLTNHQSGGGGKQNSDFVKKNGPWNKGKKTPEHTKNKISLHHKTLMDHSYKIGRKQSAITIEKRASKIRGLNSGMSKLTRESVLDIKNSTCQAKELCSKYSISLGTVSRIKNNHVYQDIN